MPTYVYRRKDGTTFEIMQSIKADALTVCPTTGQPVERIIAGGTGLIFKGSGFYQTDYARKGDGSSASALPSDSTASSTSKPESTTSPSSDAKPAPKSDGKSSD